MENRKLAIKQLSELRDALDIAINSLKVDEKYDLLKENGEDDNNDRDN